MNFDEESESLFLTNAGIKNILNLQLENDFYFIIQDQTYPCTKIQASFISPNISQILMSDPLCESFEIEINDPNHLFQNIMKILKGDSISVTASNYDFLLLIAAKFGNKEMEEDLSLMSFSENHVTFHNAIRRFISKSNLGICADTEASYIASHFYKFDPSDLELLSDQHLNAILRKDCLKIEDESWLFNFLLKRSNVSLLSYIYFEYLPEDDISKFIQVVSNEDITGPMWTAISRRLSMRVNPLLDLTYRHVGKLQTNDTPEDEDNVTIYYNVDGPFNGIIDYFTTKYGGNVHENKVVKITASGTQWNSPNVVADFSTTKFWASNNEPFSWIMYDFKEHLINLTGYTIRGDNTGSLQSWIIEGSEDGKNWYELDRHENCPDLRGLYISSTYLVNSFDNYRYIRLTQIGPGLDRTNYLNLCCLEVFGTISPNYNF